MRPVIDSLVIRARLPAEAGAVVLQALNAAMDAGWGGQNEVEPDDVTAVTSEPSKRFAQRRADALTTLTETTLCHGPTSNPLAVGLPSGHFTSSTGPTILMKFHEL